VRPFKFRCGTLLGFMTVLINTFTWLEAWTRITASNVLQDDCGYTYAGER
jgi:hypothetical protein